MKYCSNVASIDKPLYIYIKQNYSSLSSKFREDKFDIHIRLYKELEEILTKFDINDKQDMIQAKFCTAAIGTIGEIYKKNPKYKYKDRIRIIRTILSNDKVLGKFENKGIQNKIINYLSARKYFWLIEKCFNFKETMRNKFSIGYKLLINQNKHLKDKNIKDEHIC